MDDFLPRITDVHHGGLGELQGGSTLGDSPVASTQGKFLPHYIDNIAIELKWGDDSFTIYKLMH